MIEADARAWRAIESLCIGTTKPPIIDFFNFVWVNFGTKAGHADGVPCS